MAGNAASSGVSASAIEAGRAVVRFMADDSSLRRSLQILSVDLKTWGSRISNLGRTMAIAGAAGASLFIKPIMEAARVEQLMQRFSAVFADYAQSAGKFADDLARRINQSRLTLRDQLSQYGAYLKGLGFDPQVATEMSKALVQLTQDWIAFDDTIVNGQEAMDLFLSALSGEVRPARRMGADLRVAAMDAEFLAKGVKNASVKMTELERVQWRYRQINTALSRSGVIGQAEREVNTTAARIRGFKAAVLDMSVAVGNLLLPTFTRLTGKFTEAVRGLETLAASSRTMIPTLASMAVKVALLGSAFFVLGKAIAGVGTALDALKIIAAGKLIFGSPMATGVAAVAAAVLALGAAVVVSAEGWDKVSAAASKALSTITDGMASAFKAFLQYDFGRAFKMIFLSIEIAILDLANELKPVAMVLFSMYMSFKAWGQMLQYAVDSARALVDMLALAAGLMGRAIPGLDADLEGSLKALAEVKRLELEALKAQGVQAPAQEALGPGAAEVASGAEQAIAAQQAAIDAAEAVETNKAVGDFLRKNYEKYYGEGIVLWYSLKHQAARERYLLESIAKMQAGRARLLAKEWAKAVIQQRIQRSWDTGWLSQLDNFFWRMNLPRSDRASTWSVRTGFAAAGMTGGVFGIGESMDVEKKQLITLEDIKDLLFEIGKRDGAIVARLF